MPRLRVLAGPSVDALVPITPNNHKPHTIVSDLFEGKVVVHIKNFLDEQGNYSDSEYFDRDDRRDVTWSIQVQGMYFQNQLWSAPLTRGTRRTFRSAYIIRRHPLWQHVRKTTEVALGCWGRS